MTDDDPCLTLEELCSVCALEREWLVVRVREGFVPVASATADAHDAPDAEWRFTTAALARVRRMREIERTYDAAPELAALVADMLEELDALRARLRREGLL
jgi:chaperone modulatory protein CbpM